MHADVYTDFIKETISKMQIQFNKDTIVLNNELTVPIPQSTLEFQHTQMIIGGYLTQKLHEDLKSFNILHRYSIPHKIARIILKNVVKRGVVNGRIKKNHKNVQESQSELPRPKGRSFSRSTRLHGRRLHTGVRGWLTTAPSRSSH